MSTQDANFKKLKVNESLSTKIVQNFPNAEPNWANFFCKTVSLSLLHEKVVKNEPRFKESNQNATRPKKAMALSEKKFNGQHSSSSKLDFSSNKVSSFSSFIFQPVRPQVSKKWAKPAKKFTQAKKSR